MSSVGADYLAAVRFEFGRMKRLAEKAIAQVASDEALEHRLDPESNSIGILVRHLAGNMRSRWTDFLTTDGEKPDRNRDGEFDLSVSLSRTELMEVWEGGWACLLGALASLSETDLERRVRIRGEELGVVEAINRQVAHYANHVGQIVFLAKHLSASRWQALTIPRGRSAGPWTYKTPR